MNDNERMTGKALLTHLQRFLDDHAETIHELKTTTRGRGRVSSTGIRCTAMESFLDLLQGSNRVLEPAER